MAADTAVPTSIWRAAAATIGTRAIDIPSRYGFHILVAWKLGLVDAGAFYIVFSVLTLAAGAGRLGIDRAMTREVARALAVGDAPQARAAIRRGIAIVAGLSLAAGAVMALLAPLLAERLFHNPRLTMPLVLAAIAIVPMCLSAAAGGALAGLHRVALSQMIYSWLWPGLFCLLAVPLALTLRNAFLLIIAANLVCAVVAFVLLARFQPEGTDRTSACAPPLMGLGWSLFTSEIVQLLLAALPGLVLGIVASEAVVGAYAMAWRLALVLNLLVVAVAAMASPRFADCGARGDAAGLRRTAALSLGIVLALGMPVLVVLLVGAPWFLALFGEGFESGATAMRVLLLGQAWLMFSATAPELLGMTGHEKAVKGINFAAILIYAPVLVALSWWLGGTGAAVANLIAAIVSGGGAMWLARRLLGFSPPDALLATARDHWAQRRA